MIGEFIFVDDTSPLVNLKTKTANKTINYNYNSILLR